MAQFVKMSPHRCNPVFGLDSTQHGLVLIEHAALW